MSCTALCCPVLADLSCRLPHISSISIKLDADSKDGDLDPVLGLMQLHATGVQSLRIELDTSWVDHDATWALLGKLVNLTKLQLTFGEEVRVKHAACDAHQGSSTLRRMTTGLLATTRWCAVVEHIRL